MEWRGNDIFSERVERSGIQYTALLEWRLVAAWANYTWEAFCELDGEDQSAHVAAYKAEKQIEAVLAREQVRAIRRSNRMKGKR